ncbi:MAG: J domain-containing protein [Chloroflexi bacterium]|nr:J domain-containing protein [Chloroflexota bacterium]MCI0887157.1 J domain-containing protein [Chloroflexota bacterium]
MEDLYKVLQVDPRAGPEVVRAAYRVLAQKYHPDLNPSPNAADAMKRLNNAYEVLGDPRCRSEYDVARVIGMGAGTAVTHASDFADQVAAHAESAFPSEGRDSPRSARIFDILTFRQSRSGKIGLWLGILLGVLVLLLLASDINTSSGDLAYQLVTKVWVALMVFLIVWGLVWSVGDLVTLVYFGKGGAKPPDDR